MSPSRLWDARHLVIDRIEALEGAVSSLEALAFEAARRRDELRSRLDEVEGGWDRVLRNPGWAHPEDMEETFSVLASLRSELATVEERGRAVAARLSDAEAEQQVLRTIFHSVDDLAASNGGGDGDTAALRSAARHLYQGIEEDRRRIARDLREGAVPAMGAVAAHALSLDRLIRDHSHLAHQELADLEAAVRDILDSTRAVVVGRAPATLDDLGLVPSLRRLVRDLTARTGIAAELRVEGEEHALSSAEAHAIHRIVAHALDNVRRHSGAAACEVVLSFPPRAARVAVRDNGQGFDVIAAESGLDSHRTLGIPAMRELAASAGGALQIQAHLGRGTEVRALFGDRG